MQSTNVLTYNLDIAVATRPATWTARCKSGYEFNGKVCKRFTARHELLCSDCLTAEVIPSLPKLSFAARAISAIAAVIGGIR